MKHAASRQKSPIKDLSFQNLFDQYPRARMVFRVKKEGPCVLVQANKMACDFFGQSEEELLHQPAPLLFDAELTDNISLSCKKALRSQKAITVTAVPRFPGLAQEQSFILNPVLIGRGKTSQYVDMVATMASKNTLTIKRERDEALMLMNAVFDASHAGLFVTDQHRKIIRVNEAFLKHYGYSKSLLTGTDFLRFVHTEDRDEAETYHNAFIDGIRSTQAQWRIRHASGEATTPVLISTTELDYNIGRRLFVHTVIDMSAQKQMEYSLRHAKNAADGANRAKTAFLANMSHELRTPLNAIIGFSEVMKNETFGTIGNERYKEYLSDIHFSAQHLLEIINDILDMSKIEAGKFDLIETRIDFLTLSEAVKRVMADRAILKGVTIRINCSTDLPNIWADKRILRQILFNLTGNAIKFSKEGGIVAISARYKNDGQFEFSVSDNGKGMTDEQIQDVMEPFNQVQDPNIAQEETGTGLGLPLTKSMVELHQGHMRIDSRLNRGTTVAIIFPINRILENKKTAPHSNVAHIPHAV